MKHHFITIIIFVCLLGFQSKAQQNNSWLPALNNVDGTNVFDGVEAFYSFESCGNESYIVIKFINNNSFSVKAIWNHEFVLIDSQSSIIEKDKSELQIAPASSISGSCNEDLKNLKVKLSDYNINKKNLKTFVANSFELNY